MKILCVDDEIEVCNLMYDFFMPKGHVVIKATDGKEALEKVKSENPDLVFLDIRMPQMSGIEVLKEIKKINKTVPVIMVTVVKDEESAKNAIKLGAADYVTKPFSFDYLEKVAFLTELELKKRNP